MEQKDKAEFAQTVTAMASHKRQTLTSMDHRFWWEGMQTWTLADFQAAAFQLVKTKEFMPSMKDFEDLRRAGRMTAGEAWTTAVDWVRTGAYRTPAQSENGRFIDRVVSAIGGYQVIAQCAEDKLTFLERRFVEHFADMQAAADTRKALPGIASDNVVLHPLLAAGLKRLGGGQ